MSEGISEAGGLAPVRAAKPRLPRRWLIAGGLLIAFAIGLTWWFVRPRKPDYQTLSLQPETLLETIDVSGVVNAERTVQLKAGLSAKVLGRLVDENLRVGQGTPLLSIDTGPLRLQLEQARTQAQTGEVQARSELDTASAALAELEKRKPRNLISLGNAVQKAEESLFFLERELRRQQALFAEQAITRQQLDQQSQQVAQARLELRNAQTSLQTAQQTDPELVGARSRLASARNALANARRQGTTGVNLANENLSQAAVLAPFAGSITSWNVQRGDFLTPGAQIARFQDLDDLRLVLELNELDFPRVRLKAPVEISFDAYPNRKFQGAVVWLSAASVPSSESSAAAGMAGNANTSTIQVFPVKVLFANPGRLIKPGMSGDARITISRRERVLAVPIAAIHKRDGAYSVRILRQGKPTEVPVKVGTSNLEKVEIVSGLQRGDQIVLDAPLAQASPSPKP